MANEEDSGVGEWHGGCRSLGQIARVGTKRPMRRRVRRPNCARGNEMADEGRGLLAGETARERNDRWEMSNGMLRERLLMRRHARWSSCAWERKMAIGEARSLAELGMFAQSSRRGQRKRRPGIGGRDYREPAP